MSTLTVNTSPGGGTITGTYTVTTRHRLADTRSPTW